jgi:hypothetical protein
MDIRRIADIQRFYELLAELERKLSGKRHLGACSAKMSWPDRGIYFFFESGEHRSITGSGPRIVRVGTHAVSAGSKSTLWNRLSNHQGSLKSGHGNHRGSIFRLLIGEALSHKDPTIGHITWGIGSSAPRDTRSCEQPLEIVVSHYLWEMPFLWLDVDDPPSTNSTRRYIEKNSISLLSCFNDFKHEENDPPSSQWLGRYSSRNKVRQSGLWNSNHIDETYDQAFLDIMADCIRKVR